MFKILVQTEQEQVTDYSPGLRSLETLHVNEDNDTSDTVFEITFSSSSFPLKQPQANHHARYFSSEGQQQAMLEQARLRGAEELSLSREERDREFADECEAEEAEWEAMVKAEGERQAEEDRRWQQIRDAAWGNGTELDDAPLLS